MADKKQRNHLPDLVSEFSNKIQYHVNECKDKGLPPHIYHEDLHSAGMVGLHQALATYKPNRGSKFSTWASMKIKKAMDAHITSGGGDSNAVDFKHIQRARKFNENLKNQKPDIPEED
jgi:DNA-directed RNA polymerase specialized sigma subunit